MTDSRTFEDMTVLVTGASGGFGSSASRLFGERGANLVLTDSNSDGLTSLRESLVSSGISVETLSGDITDESLSRDLVELSLSTFGRLDVAINNAGIGHNPCRLPDISTDDLHLCFETNVYGVFFGMKHQLTAMVSAYESDERCGCILNVASLAGLVGSPTLSVYSAAKHAIVGLSRSAALEYARRGIRVNVLCPSFARTSMVEDGFLSGSSSPMTEDFLTRGIPMRRLAEIEEVTRSMLWICDPSNSFMTGETITIDGGTHAM